MINEHDCVVLTQNVPEEGVMAGDVGTVVHMWKSHWWRAKENPEDWTVHDHFRKLMRGRGNAPRDWLYAFMRHWLAALLDLERPDLYQCLPEDFNLGHRLPPGRHPPGDDHGRPQTDGCRDRQGTRPLGRGGDGAYQGGARRSVGP